MPSRSPTWQNESRARVMRRETAAERSDRNFQELLQELRVLQTGVQILFGFLLIFAVQPRFTELSDTGRGIYIATFVGCCLTTGLFMAPVAYHRTLFAQGRKADVVQMSNRMLKGGMVALFVTVTGAMLLVLNLVLATVVAVATAASVALCIAVLWYVLPFYHRHHP